MYKISFYAANLATVSFAGSNIQNPTMRISLVRTGLVLLLSTVASSSGGSSTTETLIGLCGKDFVLLAADAVANGGGGAFVTSSNRDKIAVFSDNTNHPITVNHRGIEHDGVAAAAARDSRESLQYSLPVQVLPTAVAAAGDAADADRLVGLLRAAYNVAHFENLADSDVLYIDCSDSDRLTTIQTSQNPQNGYHSHSISWGLPSDTGMNVHSVAQLARHCIAEPPSRGKPFRVCLLVAGLVTVPARMSSSSSRHGSTEWSNPQPQAPQPLSFSVARHVQQQVSQATASLLTSSSDKRAAATELKGSSNDEPNVDQESFLDPQFPTSGGSTVLEKQKPVLYWIDEYGALQRVSYGVHGLASHMLWSILDQGYRDDLTLEQGLDLLRECLAQLRTRYALNTQPHLFCVKVLDASGCRVIDLSADPVALGQLEQ
jgi:20S proteasome alpha/beta subunit